MASPNTGGYDQEFLDPAAKLKEFECPLCLLVTREPNQTSCCGQDFCQSCINRILTDRKPCPFCKGLNFSIFLDKKQRRKVFELRVQCSLKQRGCDWTGELRELASHTDMRNGNCQCVDVTCPNNCGAGHQRRHLDSHLSDTCPKRPFTCEYCGFKSTREEVCNKHYPECAKFPLPCPNKCEVGSVERGEMSEHLRQCPLQLVQCEYAFGGCCERIQRNDLEQHMEQTMQKHLLCAFTASQKQIMALMREMERRMEAKDQQIQEMKQQVDKAQRDNLEKDRYIEAMKQHVGEVQRETDRQIETMKQQVGEAQREKDRQIEAVKQQVNDVQRGKDKPLEEKDRQIESLKQRLAAAEGHTLLPFAEFTLSNYSQNKERSTRVDCPPFYTRYRGGVKVQVCTSFRYVLPRVEIELCHLPGEFDNEIMWPVTCTVTIHLLNQLRDQDHISGSQTFTLTGKTLSYMGSDLFVNYSTIEDCSNRGIQYLKDDCIRLMVGVELK